MNKSTTFIIQIFLDFDRPTQTVTPEWVRYRIQFFHDFTLKSLLSQNFQGFRIFMLCGNRHKDITMNSQWHEWIELCYDRGKSKYEEINTDYVSITRIDSDDLFHKDAMAEVRDNLILSEQRECLIFRKNIQWSIPNRLIRLHYRKSPPFITHIFPKSIYKNWKRFMSEHFLVHGQAGGRLPTTKELSRHKVCVVKHWENNSRIRRSLKLHILDENERQLLIAGDEDTILDRDKIKTILADFSVDEKWIK